ncbi:MAG: methyltransferase domain-containing protein, partial [Pyrinomonadaceae bacterium]
MKEQKRIQIVQRLDYLKNFCKGKKVLHLGCTNYPYTNEVIKNGTHLHLQLENFADLLYGFDYDQKGLDILTEKGVKNLYKADLEKLDEVEIDETFEVIIAGEMIEHLNNPGLFLDGIKRFMNNKTDLVITTINAYCGLRFIVYFLRGKGGVQEAVHPDHVAYYSYSTLNLILKRHSLKVTDFLFYDLGAE